MVFDYTKKNYTISTNLSFVEGSTDSNLQYQAEQLEKNDAQVSQKTQQFDNDYERLQRERGEIYTTNFKFVSFSFRKYRNLILGNLMKN